MVATGHEVAWSRLPASALRALAETDAVVILPVASTEQHGPHLATGTDTVLVTEAAMRTARRVAPRMPIVVAPTLWCGLAEHHVAFGGTFTLTHATWMAVLRDLASGLKRQGFRRLLILNGHGGNVTGLDVAATELAHDPGLPVVVGTYVPIGGTGLPPGILETQDTVMHACEAETSMMLAVAPDLVDTRDLAAAKGPGAEPGPAPMLKRWRSFADRTPTGVRGDPTRATAAKGEALLDAMADRLAAEILADPWPAR
ncbi:MAG: creatininase family protein [Rhodospirillales bacterium]|jgi:creatinine amidohydrolase